MWSSMTQALERTGEVITKAATHAGKQARSPSSTNEPQPTIVAIPPAGAATGQSSTAPSPSNPASAGPNDLFATMIADGWNTVVTSVQKAEASLNEQQQKWKARTASVYVRRDVSLPLDVPALKDIQVCYVTSRLIVCGHPALASQTSNPNITPARKMGAFGHFLNRRHAGSYLVWNLSEVEFPTELQLGELDDSVLSFSFPGSPSPPLGLLLKILLSIESFLKADPANVAVVCCLTGMGRSSLVVAAFLCWMAEARFTDVFAALAYIARTKQVDPDELSIPSQRRYASYFTNLLQGIKPSTAPLMLRRVIFSEAPKFARGIANKNDNVVDEDQLMGCVPYIQIFKAGELLHTAPASLHPDQAANELPFCRVADGNITFNVNLTIQGDILVRARHLTASKKRVSMFRVAFHTGYSPSNVLRLTKAQLDGACDDSRFSSEFFIDLIFEPVDAEEASKLLHQGEVSTRNKSSASGVDDKKNHAVQASSEDTMLHRDSRFWDVIASRMKENATEKSADDPMCGPTVGKRRDFSSVDRVDGTAKQEGSSDPVRKPDTETFSIGGEFDFLSEIAEEETMSTTAATATKQQVTSQPAEKDSLMEALMGAIGDAGNVVEDGGDELIVFDSDESPVDQAATELILSDLSAEHQHPAPAANQDSGVDDFMADLNIDDDMNALLGMDSEVVMSEEDLINMEVDDPDLEDLESFLSPKPG